MFAAIGVVSGLGDIQYENSTIFCTAGANITNQFGFPSMYVFLPLQRSPCASVTEWTAWRARSYSLGFLGSESALRWNGRTADAARPFAFMYLTSVCS